MYYKIQVTNLFNINILCYIISNHNTTLIQHLYIVIFK
jgi:hypothetical protein